MALRVAIIYGGRSVEHEISIRSAKNIVAKLDPSFDAVIIGITKKGNWYLTTEVTSIIDQGQPVQLFLNTEEPGFYNTTDRSKVEVDIIFPVLHGTDGEDGSIQGLFKSINLPVVGSSVLGSAVCMDKIIAKKILEHEGIPTAPFLSFSKSDDKEITFETITSQIGLPFMIKSGNLGSSVGVSRVNSREEFEIALKDSFNYAEEVLVEAYIDGKELECGVIGNENVESTWPGEIALKGDYGFYSYKAKYQDENAIDIIIPGRVDKSVQREIRNLSEKAYKALKCNDFARVDLFVSNENKVYINEINTIPGFTSASMFPVLWEKMGLSYTDLLSKLIKLALDRWTAENQLERSYEDA